MIRKIIFASVLALPSLFGASAASKTYTYVDNANPWVYYPTYRSETVNLAIKVNNPLLAGKKITGMRARVNSVTQNVSDCSLWLSKTLNVEKNEAGKKVNAPDIISAPAVPDADGWLEVTFDTPYTLTADEIYAGYTFTVPDYDEDASSPIIYSQTRHDGGFYFYSYKAATKWMDYEERLLGVLPVYVTVEGDFREYALCPYEWDTEYPYMQTGKESLLPLKVYNTGDKEVSSLEYSYECGDYSGTGSVTLPEPLPADIVDYAVVWLPFSASPLSGKQNLKLTVDKVNSSDNGASFPSATLPVEYRPLVAVQRAVMEEATGTWCSACPRGAVAIEKLLELYGDRFIGIAYHTGDAMESPAKAPFDVPHFPSAVLNRGDITDPFYADKPQSPLHQFAINALVDQILRRAASADVTVSARWADESCTSIEADAEVAFVSGSPSAGYNVVFVLTADGLKGDDKLWWQSNSANGLTPEQAGSLLAPLTTMGNPIKDYVYNHVALLASDEAASEVSSSLSAGEYEHHSHIFNSAEAVSTYEWSKDLALIQNNDNLEVTAILLDPQGRVENAARCKVSSASGIAAVHDAEVVSSEYYDVHGRKADSLAKGIVIRVDCLADGTRRASKIIR